jgi:hypothetical protein
MNVKITTKIGDVIKVMDDNQSKMFAGDGSGFAQLMQSKGALGIIIGMLETMEPEQVGKRVECIIEFDDGQFIAIGKKEKEIDDGR